MPKFSYIYYKAVRGFLHLPFRKAKTICETPLDDDPAVFVCNHANVNGPVMMTLHFKRPHQSWTISYAMDKEHTAGYAFHDVLFGNSHKHKKWYRFLSRIVGKCLPPLLIYAGTIPVYHDSGIIKTFKQSVKALTGGEDLVIFAESPARFSDYVCELQPGFIDLARLYYRKTKKALKFYPVYLNKKNRVISVGSPIAYDPDLSMDEQRDTITTYLRDNIDRLGRSLPPHQPVPFYPPRWYAAYGQYEHDVAGYWQMIQNDDQN